MAEKMLPIDSAKFKALLVEKYGSQARASKIVGKSEKFFGNFIHRNEMPEYATYLVEGKLGIPYEKYKLVSDDEKANGSYCEWCQEDETTFLINNDEWKVNSSLAFMPKTKKLGILALFGDETIVDKDVNIKYCPMCGRKL